MSDEVVATFGGSAFEQVKKLNEHGREYWSAREIQGLLGYDHWRGFANAIGKALQSCGASGNVPEYHFAEVRKEIAAGKGALQQVVDFELSRFACYLIAQNGDPRKPEIAIAQKYFAIQVRRQELSDQVAKDLERVDLREQTKTEFRQLSGAARKAGVSNPMFGLFHDAGYKGLYGGLGHAQLMRKKGVPENEQLMDRMDTTELAANQFRMTQAREKLAREKVRDEQTAIRTHEQVGKEVRTAIGKIGGTMPENIPPAEHIETVAKRIRATPPKLLLDDEAAKGLVGDESRPPGSQ